MSNIAVVFRTLSKCEDSKSSVANFMDASSQQRIYCVIYHPKYGKPHEHALHRNKILRK